MRRASLVVVRSSGRTAGRSTCPVGLGAARVGSTGTGGAGGSTGGNMSVIRRVAVAVTMAVALVFVGIGGGVTAASASPSVVDIGLWSPNFQGVYCVQQALNIVAGAGLDVDGKYGPATRNAVENFQRFFKITPYDGIVGKRTGDMIGYTHDLRT